MLHAAVCIRHMPCRSACLQCFTSSIHATLERLVWNLGNQETKKVFGFVLSERLSQKRYGTNDPRDATLIAVQSIPECFAVDTVDSSLMILSKQLSQPYALTMSMISGSGAFLTLWVGSCSPTALGVSDRAFPAYCSFCNLIRKSHAEEQLSSIRNFVRDHDHSSSTPRIQFLAPASQPVLRTTFFAFLIL